MNPRWPHALPDGATIGLVSPASASNSQAIERGMAALASRGYRPVLLPHAREEWWFVAGEDDGRLADLHQAFADPDIDAVWCLRGGYGCIRLLARLDWDLLAANPKPFIGYSDITTLQNAFIQRLGWVSFSGPMVASGHGYARAEGIDAGSERDLFRWLRPTADRQPLVNPDGTPFRVLQPGAASGRLIGGNLALFTALVGTPYLPDTRGALLAIEDVGEHPYNVDRMLCQLELSGVLDQLGALLIGDFAGYADDEHPGPDIETVVRQRVGSRPLPVLSNVIFGHTDVRQTLPLGACADLRADGAQAEVVVQVG